MYSRISPSPARGPKVHSATQRLLAVGLVVLFSACVMSQSHKADEPATATATATTASPKTTTTTTTTAKAGADKPGKTAKAEPKGDKATAAKTTTTTTTAAASTPAKKGAPDTAKLAQEVKSTLASAGTGPVATTTEKAAPEKAAKPAPQHTGLVSVNWLNIRMAPSEKAPIVGKLARGSTFKVTVQGDWGRLGDGQWVLVKHLKLKTAATSPAGKKKLTASK